MLIQTLAIFIDAFRELRSRKLFWVAILISALTVLAFALVGINDGGLVIFGKVLFTNINTRLITAEEFYKGMFIGLGVKFLTWASTLLAIISTGSIFSDFVSAGSVELYLSRPIGRARLFLTRYLAGLLFAALQISTFCAAAFILVGIRTGTWFWGFFLAVPLVVCFFSYLFCISALVGSMTRSSLAAILATFLAWTMFFALHATEVALYQFRIENDHKRLRMEAGIQILEGQAQWVRDHPSTNPAEPQRIATRDAEIARARQELSEFTNPITPWHNAICNVKLFFPKTTETMDLMSRWLMDATERQDLEATRRHRRNRDREAMEELQAELVARPATTVIGTSLAFEAVVLLFATWRFSRRDY